MLGKFHEISVETADIAESVAFYERLGFRSLTDDELTPALRAVVDHEAELGLDPAARVVMRRDVGSKG